MNGREGAVTSSVFIILSAIILLQILAMVQSDRIYDRLNLIEEKLENATIPHQSTASLQKIPEKCSGDEGDWLIWAFRVEPRTLNPISAEADIYTRWITLPYIFEPLLNHDHDDMKLKPWLAEKYEVSDDGTEITFYLKTFIHFSDRVPLTADDVIFTYETIINPKVDTANSAIEFADVQEVVRINDHVVKFVMERPYLKSLKNLPFTWSIGILPRHIYEFSDPNQFNKHVSNPVGSGPYVLEKWDIGKMVVLRRNENYWGSIPKLRKIVYRFISNPLACVQALRSRQVDMIIPEPEQFAELVNDEQFCNQFQCLKYWTPWTPYYYIGWNQESKFFSDKRVRLAMTHIIDRKKIIAHLLDGYGQEITGPFYVFELKNDPNIEPWPYNPSKAKQLLAEAGWQDTDKDGVRDKDGIALSFRLMYSRSYALYERLARLLKDEASKIGIDIVLEPCEWSILQTRLNSRVFDAYIAGWGGDTLEEPYRLFHSSQIGKRGFNYVGFSNRQADAIIEQALNSTEDDERDRLHRRLHRILHQEQPYTFLFTRPTFRLVDRRFNNVVIHKLGLNYLEWYVPKNEQRYQ